MLVVINLIMAYNNYIKCLHTQAHTHKYTRAHTYTYTDNFITVQRSLFHIPKSQYRSHPFMTSTRRRRGSGQCGRMYRSKGCAACGGAKIVLLTKLLAPLINLSLLCRLEFWQTFCQ